MCQRSREATVVAEDASLRVDHQNAVGGRLQGRMVHRDRMRVVGLGASLRRHAPDHAVRLLPSPGSCPLSTSSGSASAPPIRSSNGLPMQSSRLHATSAARCSLAHRTRPSASSNANPSGALSRTAARTSGEEGLEAIMACFKGSLHCTAWTSGRQFAPRMKSADTGLPAPSAGG